MLPQERPEQAGNTEPVNGGGPQEARSNQARDDKMKRATETRANPRSLAMLAAVSVVLAGCEEALSTDGATVDAESSQTDTDGSVELFPDLQQFGPKESVEAPDVFQVAEAGLWDGRPSLGGIWVAHPDVTQPERVRDQKCPEQQISDRRVVPPGKKSARPRPATVLCRGRGIGHTGWCPDRGRGRCPAPLRSLTPSPNLSKKNPKPKKPLKLRWNRRSRNGNAPAADAPAETDAAEAETAETEQPANTQMVATKETVEAAAGGGHCDSSS